MTSKNRAKLTGEMHGGTTLYVIENGKTVKYVNGKMKIVWDRELTMEELESLAKDPYQMFKDKDND